MDRAVISRVLELSGLAEYSIANRRAHYDPEATEKRIREFFDTLDASQIANLDATTRPGIFFASLVSRTLDMYGQFKTAESFTTRHAWHKKAHELAKLMPPSMHAVFLEIYARHWTHDVNDIKAIFDAPRPR